MDKLNNYIPVPVILPQPKIEKQPCLTPACMEINKKFEASMKQLQSQPILHNTKQLPLKK
jgi:hypothetical protein